MDVEQTPDIKISASVVDRLAGLMVLLQKANPTDLLYDLKNLREVAGYLQTELQKVRGPWVICHLCNPAERLKMEDIYQHDVEKHNAYRSR